ncbi:Glycosyltransferase [Quillaja saponaria]|uniref:Glycosyltransferase n=1 Tax=Quillaja saponaria TaxID=32244 RepID=A0AAD7L8V7_QUISA|nr:Glycosyltransferase [Quillaja saponaria]
MSKSPDHQDLPLPGSDQLRQQAAQDLESDIAKRYEVSDLPRPLCAIVDFQMGWTKFVFWKFNIPVIGFFTFGACAAAMEWAAWKTQVGDLKVGELRLIPWLPIEMSLTYSDLKRKTGGPVGTGGRGPPKPGDRPPWVNEVEGSIALIFNTCDDLERPFITYMNIQMNMPVWGVGPLLPERYLKFNSSASQLLRDSEIREHKRQSNHTEEEIIHWLDSKPRGSVIYVGFGSEVGPTMEEYHQLSAAFEQSTRPFIWVIQPKSNGVGGDSKVGSRGLIIYGWAPAVADTEPSINWRLFISLWMELNNGSYWMWGPNFGMAH